MSSNVYELKCWPEPFAAMRSGLKRFEFRRDDRGFKVGDVLLLNEWEPDCEPGPSGILAGSYSGESFGVMVRYILRGPAFGVPDGFVIMDVERISAESTP